ncbi:MAG: transketolase C-terminal domain-containing protein [bacterium]|nr:transketolase C-terminal domain-containing protein [bacterium]MDZ4285617.1 transketolase C-terminal domain-containing protein [Candidatus Sungbacteria bacterium]
MYKPKRETAFDIYRLLARTRSLNEILEMKRSRIEGPVLTGMGAEAISIGVCVALFESGILDESLLHGDQRMQYGFLVGKNYVPNAHDHAYEILKNYALTQTAPSQGEDGNIHTGCMEHGVLPFATSDMGRMIPVLLGMAEEMRRITWPEIQDTAHRPVAIGGCGEGAMNQGCIHEAMNWVAASNCRLNDEEMRIHDTSLDRVGRELRVLRGAPMIFIINSNQFSIYTEEREEHGRSDIAARAYGYGDMRGVNVNGWDVFDVIEKTHEAIRDAQVLRSSLLHVKTYRLTGHNSDMITRKAGRIDEGEIRNVSLPDFRRAWGMFDPLAHCRLSLVAWEYATQEQLLAIDQEEMRQTQMLFERAFTEEPEATMENRSVKTLMIPHTFSSAPVVVRENGASKRMRYNEAFIEVMREILCDSRVTAFGQDIHMGGVLGETAGRDGYLLAQEFGHVKVHTTPISEEAMTSVAAGRSLYRGKAFCFYQFAPFWADAYPSWRSVIAPNFWQKGMRFDVKGIFPFGVVHDGGSGEYHESCVEAPLLSMGGVVLLFPTDAYDLVGMMRAAYEYPGPVAIFLQIHAFGKSEFGSIVPEERYVIPFGSARVRREGSDVSVFAYGAACVRAACNEAEFLSRFGVDMEIVDIRCVEPLDIETLARSARKTGRVIIMHEADWRHGCGVHIKHQLDSAGASIYAKTPETACLLTADDNPIPTKKKFLWSRLPFEQYVVKSEDNFGDQRTILRSKKLNGLARKLKEVYR